MKTKILFWSLLVLFNLTITFIYKYYLLTPKWAVTTILLIILLIAINSLVHIHLFKDLSKFIRLFSAVVMIPLSFLFWMVAQSVFLQIQYINYVNNEYSELKDYPIIKEIEENKRSLKRQYTFNKKYSYDHQGLITSIPNGVFTYFRSKSTIGIQDFEYLISWLREIKSVPYYIRLYNKDKLINVIYDEQGKVTFCYPRDEQLCHDIDPVEWIPIIGSIKESQFNNAFGVMEFEDIKSNQMSTNERVNLFFYVNHEITKYDIESLVNRISIVDSKSKNFMKRKYIFEFTHTPSGRRIILETEMDDQYEFLFDHKSSKTCEIIEVCGEESI